jgi:uncharacterized protein involved in outer membrane biogenesis
LAGSLPLTDEPKHFDVQLSSPRLDLSPFMAKEKQEKGAAAPAPEKPKPEKSDTPKPKFVFDEKPLPLDKMKETNGKLHVSFGELVLAERSFKDVDSNIQMDHGKLIFDFRAAGVQEGTLQGEGNFVPGANGTADLNLKIDLANVRASLASEGLSPTDVPPLGLAMNIKIHGSSPRQTWPRAPTAAAVDARRGQNQERPDQCLRWRRFDAAVGEAQSFCQGRSVHEARLHDCAGRHRQW